MPRLRVPLGPSRRTLGTLAPRLGVVLGLSLAITQVTPAQQVAAAATPVLGIAPVGPTTSADTASRRPAPIITWGDLKGAAVGTGLTVLAIPFDGRVRQAIRREQWQRVDAWRDLARGGNLWGDPTVLALSTGMWIGGRFTDHPRVAQVGLRAFESIGVSGVITRVLKMSIGRARPNHPPYEVWDVEFGRGWKHISRDGAYEAMPSGHTTAAFAFASAVSGEVARIAPAHAQAVRLTSYGLATWTAYSRMHTDAHWLSDVIMGATVGTVTGWAVTRWHATRPGNPIDRLLLGDAVVTPIVTAAPLGGTRVGVSLAWR